MQLRGIRFRPVCNAAGADGVQLGVVGILRPWRMKRMIRYAHELFWPDVVSLETRIV